MLNRRHIRIKVMQALYARESDSGETLRDLEVFLEGSMSRFYDLFLFMLSLFLGIRNEAERRQELLKSRHLVHSDELDPQRWIQNKFIRVLLASDLEKLLIEKEVDLKSHQTIHQRLYDRMIISPLFKKYTSGPEPGFKEDKNFVLHLYKQVICPDEKLYELLEDKELTWLDDFPVVNNLILGMLSSLNSADAKGWKLPTLYKNDEDKDFTLELFRKVALNRPKLMAEFIDITPNWDKDRIAELDSILIRMGIAEFLWFPSIPVKVTINEYLEISKDYSTEKSNIFINGVLDKVSKQYVERGTLNKSGRGLL